MPESFTLSFLFFTKKEKKKKKRNPLSPSLLYLDSPAGYLVLLCKRTSIKNEFVLHGKLNVKCE